MPRQLNRQRAINEGLAEFAEQERTKWEEQRLALLESEFYSMDLNEGDPFFCPFCGEFIGRCDCDEDFLIEELTYWLSASIH